MSEKIRQLSEKEKVRKKISVWLGASNHIAVIHTVKELIGNSVDEINKGNGDKIKITLHNKKTITIEDNCKGLPLEGINENGIENYKLLFETLFAGTKYYNGIENNDYTVGTNGLFLTVLTFSSQHVRYEIARPNKNVYVVEYEKGNNIKPLTKIGKSDATYTKITYTLDDDIFEDNYFTFDELCQIASEQASLINGSIIVENKETNEVKKYRYENGILDFLNDKIKNLNEINDAILITKDVSHSFKKEGKDVVDDIKIAMAIKYTKEDENNTQIEFLNGSNLIHHGTIYDGLVGGLRTVFNKYLKENGLYKKSEKQITKDDVIVGLNYVIDFKSYFPIYANQTKFASYVKYYESIMKNVIEEFFEVYAIENKFDMDKIANQILINKRSRENAERTRLDIKKKLQKSTNTFEKVDKLIECRSKDPKERELYIAEGDSAKGSLLKGRNKIFQSIYPIRGKILSCLKATPQQIFNNEVITNIYKILGCGVELKDKNNKFFMNFSLDNLQYNKIIIASDQDDDGHQISALLLTMFYVLTPTLLKEGYIYRAESPLFEIYDFKTDKLYYAYTEKERDEIIKNNKLTKFDVSRNKGLGELQAETIEETLMNPATRRLVRFTIEDVQKAVETLELFMGTDVESRRNYIEKHFDEYEFEF